MISLRHPQRSLLVRLLARGLICLLVLAGTPLEVWAYVRFDPPLSSTKTSMGNRETATDDRGTTTYTYDNRNRLETLTYPDGRKLTYGYDANGNRTSLTAEVGGQTLTTTYSYDALNRLQTVTDSEGRDYVHEYDPNGNRSTLTYPNNTETTYVYDDLNRLTNLTTINTATLGMIQSYQYTLGAAGNRERIDEHDGTARAYTYDDLYRLEKETISDSVGLVYEKTFVYDPVGNRQSQTTVGTGAPGTPLAPGTIEYTYDDRDRILTEGTQPFGWDENGNLVTKDAEATYFWDFDTRLARVEKADGTLVTHAYDADGNRVRTEVSPSTGPPEVTEFLVDPSGFLSHVVVESTDSGVLTAQYVRGDDLLSVIRSAETRYFHADGLGSIRRLTSEAGSTTDGYTYSAFGELLAHTGSDEQPYSFTGEPRDPNVGWQYHRARWVAPRWGRFVSQDPFGGVVQDPPSLHRYLYVSLNPVGLVDPSGRFASIGEISIGLSIVQTIAGQQVFAGFDIVTDLLFSGNAVVQQAKVVINAAGAAIALSAVAVTVLRSGWFQSWLSKLLRRGGGRAPQAAGSLTIAEASRLSGDEMATGTRLAAKEGLDLRESSHVGAEFVDSLGRSYDALGTPAASRFWDSRKFFASIDAHLRKSNNFTVIDLTDFTESQIAEVASYVAGLPASQRAKIKRVGF